MAQSSRIIHKPAMLNKPLWFCPVLVSPCCCAEQVQHQRQQHVSSAAARAEGLHTCTLSQMWWGHAAQGGLWTDGTEVLKTQGLRQSRTGKNLKNCVTGGSGRIVYLLKILSHLGLQGFINDDLTKNQAARLLKMPANNRWDSAGHIFSCMYTQYAPSKVI